MVSLDAFTVRLDSASVAPDLGLGRTMEVLTNSQYLASKDAKERALEDKTRPATYNLDISQSQTPTTSG